MCVHVAEVLWVERFALSLQTDHPASALDLVASSLHCNQWFFENRKSDFHSFAQSQIQTPYRCGPAGPLAPTSSLLSIHFSPSLHPSLSSGLSSCLSVLPWDFSTHACPVSSWPPAGLCSDFPFSVRFLGHWGSLGAFPAHPLCYFIILPSPNGQLGKNKSIRIIIVIRSKCYLQHLKQV